MSDELALFFGGDGATAQDKAALEDDKAFRALLLYRTSLLEKAVSAIASTQHNHAQELTVIKTTARHAGLFGGAVSGITATVLGGWLLRKIGMAP